MSGNEDMVFLIKLLYKLKYKVCVPNNILLENTKNYSKILNCLNDRKELQ